jgi:uncharacterized protein (TIRG00374 family)
MLGLAVSVGAIVLLAVTVDLDGMLQTIRRAALPPLGAVLVVISLQLAIRTSRWQVLLPRTVTGERVPWRRLMPVLLVGYLGNSLLPARLGEAVRAYLVSKREEIPLASALGSVLLERIGDVSTLAAIAFGAAVLAGASAWIVQGTALSAVVGLVGLALLFGGVLELLARVLPNGRIGELVRTFARSAGRQPRADLLLALLLSCLAWLLDATTFFLVGESLALQLAFPTALLIGAVTVIGTAIPSSPGYIGTFELAAVAAATALGVPSDDALALAILAHAITSLPIAMAGAFALTGMSLDLRVLAREAEGLASASGTSSRD